MRLKTLLFSGLLMLSSATLAHHEATNQSDTIVQLFMPALIVATLILTVVSFRQDLRQSFSAKLGGKK